MEMMHLPASLTNVLATIIAEYNINASKILSPLWFLLCLALRISLGTLVPNSRDR